MFKQDFLTGDKDTQMNTHSKAKKISNRRTSKMLVELSIGIIGIIAVMLAQIASHQSTEPMKRQSNDLHSNNPHFNGQGSVVYQLTDDIAGKVASLTEVSPLATRVNWLNILF